MYDYFKGQLTQVTPTFIVLETNNIGYFIHISLHTYSSLSNYALGEVKIYLHLTIREDAHIFYGFFGTEERDIFKLLISVSGIGANTARMILSSLTPDEVKDAIQVGNVAQLQNVKGIGAKSAQRVIIDLRDKIGKLSGDTKIILGSNNTIRDEAFSALVMLGFSKIAVEKAVNKILMQDKVLSVEELIKKALKSL